MWVILFLRDCTRTCAQYKNAREMEKIVDIALDQGKDS